VDDLPGLRMELYVDDRQLVTLELS